MTTRLLPSVLNQWGFSLIPFCMLLNVSQQFKFNLIQCILVWPWHSFNYFIWKKIVFFLEPQVDSQPHLFIISDCTHSKWGVFFIWGASLPYFTIFHSQTTVQHLWFFTWHDLESVLKSSGKDGSKSRVMVREKDAKCGESRFLGWRDEATACTNVETSLLKIS